LEVRDSTKGLSQIDHYSGIPYAEPPLGDLRLKPSVLKTLLDVETFDATNFGKGCLQPVRQQDAMMYYFTQISEGWNGDDIFRRLLDDKYS